MPDSPPDRELTSGHSLRNVKRQEDEMKTEKEIREMLEYAIGEIQYFPSGSGEQVWQDGFIGALRTVLEEPAKTEGHAGENEHIHQMHRDALTGIATCTLCRLTIEDKQAPKTRAQKDAETMERTESRAFDRACGIMD